MPGVHIISKKISIKADRKLTLISGDKITFSALAIEEKHLNSSLKAEEINIEGGLMTNIKGGVVILDMAGPASPAQGETAATADISYQSRQATTSGNTIREAQDRAEQDVEDYVIVKKLPFFSLSN